MWPYNNHMATMTIKSTYSMDVETVQTLEQLARRWKVSKSEALRRAIRAAASRDLPVGADGTDALDELQRSLGMSAAAARRWETDARSERRASSGRSKETK
jgi:hypothetical protein